MAPSAILCYRKRRVLVLASSATRNARYLKFQNWTLRWVFAYGEWSSGSRPSARTVTRITLLVVNLSRCE